MGHDRNYILMPRVYPKGAAKIIFESLPMEGFAFGIGRA
jgi:hypothetical protein